ncbi:dTDP-4-dehydrorhamnose 3,5-epimerase [Halomonas aquatica]|uniref:dTDP-4-dehydrorhamnose 3,5-epimerase n=1 Tax=Halomonas aquatica TaxID=3151123 RepID=A0ABV1NE48_9GAMM
MKITETRIPDVKLLEPHVFEDERGFFYESFNQKAFDAAVGQPVTFVQDNHSRSAKNTLRGLHYQLPPHPQGKLVRVTLGEVFDVAVDIRKSSPTCGRWVGATLSADNRRQLWIPPGFAHGFLVASDVAEFQYKCTDFYAPDCEVSIRWDDATLAINWPVMDEPLISVKDGKAPAYLVARKFE